MTSIAVLGTGNVGATLARKWAAAGHHVLLGGRDPTNARLRVLADELGAVPGMHTDAIADAQVVVFAVPGQAMTSLLETVGASLDGKIVIDATNRPGESQMSSVAAIRDAAPNAAVARAFNSMGWENYANPDFAGTKPDLLWCGPDGQPDAIIEQLITDVGLRPIRVGGLEQLDTVDTLARLWFALVQRRGRNLAFKILTR
jgi:8-hydroxy-5-deazaflavin:NADPH oxidoreductase